MPKLFAHFDIKIPGYLLVYREKDDKFCYETEIDEFNVNLCLIAGDFRAGKVDDKNWTIPVSRVKLIVSRDESVEPPPVCNTNDGTRDYTAQYPYFKELLPAYQKAVLIVLNRLLLFFKYKLHNPFLHEMSDREQSFHNPKWFTEAGVEVGKQYTVMSPGIKELVNGSFGINKLTLNEDEELKQALQIQVIPELYEELLSDAQTAIFQGNFRRAVLEMAITCEVAIKQAFFKKYSAAGAAYEYLEDKGRVNISVTELIHGAAKEAFGESFKDVCNTEYKNIDFLFRCRNKIAHRGEVVYKDDTGNVHKVSLETLKEWWKSVEMLFDWLKKQQLK